MSEWIPDNLRVARRTLDIIPSVKILSDWRWRDDVRQWVLHCQIGIESTGKLIPPITEWYVLAASEYPFGNIKFYPSKRNGLTGTFPHQNFNGEGTVKVPWRTGDLCLSSSLQATSYHNRDIEPDNAYWRLHWRFERAIQWLTAASQGTLVSPGDNFELPCFPTRSSATVVFSEGIESFSRWRGILDWAGLVELISLDRSSSILYVKSFRSARDRELLVPTWGRFMTGLNAEMVRGIWIRLKDIPVLEPWQVPSNWNELRYICREQNIELDEKLREVIKMIRDGYCHPLLLGFPVPSKVGDYPCQMHWQAIELPILSNLNKTARGFRTNELGYWQRDRTEILCGPKVLSWRSSENWHPDQISTRGRFPEMMADKQVLVIGVGALGSVVAEILIRGNVQKLLLIDADKLEIGNLSRHTLTRNSLNENKALGVAARLNLISPHAVVDAIECEFPFVDKTRLPYVQRCDMILDCTGSDTVLHHLEHFAWNDKKIFISLSLGMGGRRLFCFVAFGNSFPRSAFLQRLQPWLEREHAEYKDYPLPWSGIGCWHPVFPARVDDIWMMASVAVKYTESLINNRSLKEEFAIFERVYNPAGDFCGVRKVECNEASH